MTIWVVAIGLIEFLLQPTLGKWSDAIGRKPFLLASPFLNLLVKTLVSLSPSPLTMAVEMILGDGMRVVSNTMVQASITDLSADSTPSILGENLGGMVAAAGVGVLLGPVVGGQVVEATGGSLTAPYTLAAGVSAVALVMTAVGLPEPLDESKRRPFSGFVNPLSFIPNLFFTGDTSFSLLNIILVRGHHAFLPLFLPLFMPFLTQCPLPSPGPQLRL
jgi:DHA1 family tetracycline resistance protein-like MFS transporter